MKRLSKLMLLVMGYGLLVVVLSSILSYPASAQGPSLPVRVTNTGAQAVPTVAQGTTTVAGSVSVANTPSVNVINTPSVNVANNTSNPIPVNITNNIGRTPWWQSLASVSSGPPIGPSSYTVPSGYRVVIEYANVHAIYSRNDASPGPTLGTYVPEVLLRVVPGSIGSEFDIELSPAEHVFSTTGRFFAASLPIKVILLPGWVIDVADNAADDPNSGGGSLLVYLSGYMEPAP